MAGFSKAVLTTKGKALYAKAQAGTIISFTRAKIGSGTLTAGQNLEYLTDLISVVTPLAIQGVSYLGNSQTRIRTVITNSGLSQGFYFREIGLYATDPQEGEILYCVANAGDQADYIPAEGSVAVEQVMDIIAVVGNGNVTASIESGAYATAIDLSAHRLAKPLDHPDDSVTDAKIGNRTVNDNSAASADTGTLSAIINGIATVLKAVTGKSSWRTAPAISLETVSGLIVATAAANKLLKLDSNAKLPADITGNAATATKLQTARTINSVSFDGTANITLPYASSTVYGTAKIYISGNDLHIVTI